MLELVNQGLSNDEIARRYNCTYRTVLRVKRSLGLSNPHPRNAYRFTDADRAELASLLADGWPISEISATKGWEYETVLRHAGARSGWRRQEVSDFGAAMNAIRKNATRPDWLPPLLGSSSN